MERLICLLIGYGFGLFETSILIGKVLGFDIRRSGSGNAGTTNMLRTKGAGLALATMIGDILKGALAVMVCAAIFRRSCPEILPLLRMYAGIGAILGHDFPFYLQFKGGKGVATTGGVMLAFHPVAGVLCFVVFFSLFFLTHYVSVCSLTAYGFFFAEVLFLGLTGRISMAGSAMAELYVMAFLLTALCWWQHRENIKRLLRHEEKQVFIHKKNEAVKRGEKV